MTLNLSSSRIVMVILSVAANAASGAGGSTQGKLMPPPSGHLNLAKSGHYNLASTHKLVIIYLMSNYVLERMMRVSEPLVCWSPSLPLNTRDVLSCSQSGTVSFSLFPEKHTTGRARRSIRKTV